MKLSGGVEWALHCCVVLGQAETPVPAARLAQLHGVSPTYLAKTLQALSHAGLVRSTQGKAGGYLLTRAPDAITLLDVVDAVEGSEPAFRCTEIRQRGLIAVPAERCTRPCAIARAMHAAEDAYRAALATVSVADLTADVQTDTDGTAMPAVRRLLAGA